MKQLLNTFFNRPFVRNVAVLTTGTVGAQAASILFSPIITRLYGPEAYGLMGSFQAMMLILVPIAALTFPIAMVLPKEKKEVKGIIKISFRITLVLMLIALLLVLFFNDEIVNLFQLNEISPYMLFIPIVILTAGISQIYEQWLIREKKFGISAKSNFGHKLFTNVGKSVGGLIYPTAGVLVFFSAIAYGVRALLMIFYTKKNLIKESMREKIDLGDIVKKYKEFPFYRAPEVFINAVSSNVPVLALTSFFGPAAAGFYTIGRSVLGIPSQLIGKSIGDAFYPRVSEGAHNKENITGMIFKTTLTLAVLGIIPFGLLMIFGPSLFSIVFGSSWTQAGVYARWMALSTYLIFINKPSVMALPVLRAQKFQLIYTILILVLRVIALYIGFLVFEDDVIAVALFSIVGGVLNIGLIGLTLIISYNFDKNNKAMKNDLDQ